MREFGHTPIKISKNASFDSRIGFLERDIHRDDKIASILSGKVMDSTFNQLVDFFENEKKYIDKNGQKMLDFLINRIRKYIIARDQLLKMYEFMQYDLPEVKNVMALFCRTFYLDIIIRQVQFSNKVEDNLFDDVQERIDSLVRE